MERTQASIKEFFEHQLERYGAGSPSALHWNSSESQEIRFAVLAMIAPLHNSTILDVGSGVGDLYGFLKKEKIELNYTGWDISEKMVEAARDKYPEGHFEVRDLLESPAEDGGKFDYVLASGTMNVRVRNHLEYQRVMIKKMYNCAKKGAAINFLSQKSVVEKDEENFFYADPLDIFQLCMSLTPYVSMRHDYLPHDFTVYLYKMS